MYLIYQTNWIGIDVLAVTEGKQITATKGTMKRKRQVREFMDNMNKNYEDDYFDSTPVKAAKPLKVCQVLSMRFFKKKGGGISTQNCTQ